MKRAKKRYQRSQIPEQVNAWQAMIVQVQRHWSNRWVWFDPGDGSGVQKGLVTLITGRGRCMSPMTLMWMDATRCLSVRCMRSIRC